MKSFFDKIKFRLTISNDIKRRKKIYIFSSFILLSFVLWFIIKLSKYDESTVYAHWCVVNTPDTLKITEKNDSIISADVRALGSHLLYENLRSKDDCFVIDFFSFKNLNGKEGKYNYFITKDEISDLLEDFFYGEMEIIHIYPDTIFIETKVNEKKSISVSYD